MHLGYRKRNQSVEENGDDVKTEKWSVSVGSGHWVALFLFVARSVRSPRNPGFRDYNEVRPETFPDEDDILTATSDASPTIREVAERARAQELADAGVIVRLWRQPGRWANWGLWRSGSPEELHEVLSSLPLYPWLSVTVHPLARHPSDPRESP